MSKINKTIGVKEEIDRFNHFMLKHEYTVSTTTGYGNYLARFLSRPVPTDGYSLEKSIFIFLNAECRQDWSTTKGLRASLYLYFRMVTGINYPKRPVKESNLEIEAILERFYDYSVNIKRIRPGSAIQEVTFIRGFLEYISGNQLCHLINYAI